MNCTGCTKRMWTASQHWEGNQRWLQCRNCEHWQLEEPTQGLRIPPKVLYYDIETSLVEMNIKTFDMRVRSGWLDWHDITKPFYVISWAAAWVYDRKLRIHSDAVTACEAKRRRDKRCLRGLWDLMDRADYLVGHNIKSFDNKKVETRFLLNHMGKPFDSKYTDTLTLAKKHFKPESQSLDYWMKLLEMERKEKMKRDDWLAVNEGDQRAINKMHRYNRGDIRRGVALLRTFVEYVESNGGKKVFR